MKKFIYPPDFLKFCTRYGIDTKICFVTESTGMISTKASYLQGIYVNMPRPIISVTPLIKLVVSIHPGTGSLKAAPKIDGLIITIGIPFSLFDYKRCSVILFV